MEEALRAVLVWVVLVPISLGGALALLISGISALSPSRFGDWAGFIASIAGGIVLTLLVAFASWRLFDRPPWPPREALHYLLHAAAISLPLALLPTTLRSAAGRWVSLALAITCAAVAISLIPPRFTWAGWGLLVWPLLMVIFRTVDDREVFEPNPACDTRRARPWQLASVPIVLAGTLCAGVAVCLAATGSLKLAKVSGILAFLWLGLLAGTLISGRLVCANPGTPAQRRGLIAATLALIACLLGQGVHLGSTDGSTLIVLVCGLCAAAAACILWPRAAAWKRAAAAGLTMLGAAGLAAALAYARYKAALPLDDYGY
ncbi:MAG: hypothetical protein KF859_00310 [Phycisphaeraceae bacterium]|nr:hypothetical protein [Phycisphaeraceae bacterium]